MTTRNASDPIYINGDSDHERRRLKIQSDLVNPFLRDMLLRAGIGTGMRVLDVGSGAGDVAIVAAEVVGETGSIVGIDLNPSILETARARVADAGHHNVTFAPGDIRTIELEGTFDAVIGRAVLMYMSDPTAALRRTRSFVRPGGKVAFLEYDTSAISYAISFWTLVSPNLRFSKT